MKRAFKNKNQNHIYHKPRGADKIRFDGRNWVPLWFAEESPLSRRLSGVKESKHKLKCLNSRWKILVTTFSIVLLFFKFHRWWFLGGLYYNNLYQVFSVHIVFGTKVLIHCGTVYWYLRTAHPVIHTPFTITCQPFKLITF